MSHAIPAYRRPARGELARRVFSSRLFAAFAAVAAFSDSARADPAVTLPAPPFAAPFLPSISNDWTVKIGIQGALTPNFYGANDLAFNPSPIFSIQRAGSPNRFISPRDNPSIALFDYGRFRAGPVLKFDPARTSSSDKALRGLPNVGAAVELGAFAEYFPVDWFRTRLEVRNGFGGHQGVVGDLSADAIIPLTERLTFSGGPRFSLKDAKSLSPYFNVDAAESIASGLPEYRLKGATASTGVGAQLGYMLTPQWEVHGYVEYERLLNGAASSPLIKLRGSPDQVTVGLGVSYSFDVKVR